jgi:hypothetical protein
MKATDEDTATKQNSTCDKLLAIVTKILLALALFLAIADQRPAHEPAIEPKNAAAHQSQPAEPSRGLSVDAPHQSGSGTSAQNSTRSWVDRLNALSTTIIALFTAFTFGAIRTQITTNRDTERAWIISTPTENAPTLGFAPIPNESNIQAHLSGRGQKNVFSCAFKNTGNTPARLISVAMRYRKAATPADIPTNPDDGDTTALNNLPLVKNDSIGFETALEPEPMLDFPEVDAIAKGDLVLYAYGAMKYLDVYGRRHESRFGYIYHFPHGAQQQPKGFRREGLPAEYNRAS